MPRITITINNSTSVNPSLDRGSCVLVLFRCCVVSFMVVRALSLVDAVLEENARSHSDESIDSDIADMRFVRELV